MKVIRWIVAITIVILLAIFSKRVAKKVSVKMAENR